MTTLGAAPVGGPSRGAIPGEGTGADRGERDPSRSGDCGVMSRRLHLDAEGSFAVIAEALSLGRELWLDASGGSMYPVVPSGSRVLVVPRSRRARIGDVVLVRRGDRLILHRVRTAAGDRIVTRGDACLNDDPGIPDDRALGLAVACDDGRGVRPLSPFIRWFGLLPLVRWARAEAHRRLRRYRA